MRATSATFAPLARFETFTTIVTVGVRARRAAARALRSVPPRAPGIRASITRAWAPTVAMSDRDSPEVPGEESTTASPQGSACRFVPTAQ